MSGRFFKGVSDSESESSEAESDILPTRPHPVTSAFPASDEEEEAKRVVRTAKEKRYEELHTIIRQIRNHKKIKDISKMLSGFENLTRAFQKAKLVIEREENNKIPTFYLRCLVELETFVQETWEDREGRKNMSKQNSKSLATLRQKLRKYSKDYETEINNYKKNPVEDDEKEEESEDEESDESDSDDDGPMDFMKKPEKEIKEDFKEEPKDKDVEDDDESDDSYWQGSSDESSLTSDDEKYGGNRAKNVFERDTDKSKEPTKRRRKPKEGEHRKQRIHEEEDEQEEGRWKEVQRGGIPGEKPKMFSKDEEINHQSVIKKLLEILAMRGKKRIHRSDQIEMLVELLDICGAHKLGPAIETKVTLGIIAALFEYNPNVSPCMKPENWQKCIKFANLLFDILLENPDIVVSENIAEEAESFIAPSFRVHGCALTLVEKMDEEFTKLLQAVDPHSPDYIERLKDEKNICTIIERLQKYLEANQKGTSSELCRAYILRIDHLYFKFDPLVFKKREQQAKARANSFVNGDGQTEAQDEEKKEVAVEDKPEEPEIGETSLEVIDRLCKYIYAKDATDRLRTQAILCHIYHHALHDNWFEARDLMLMSQLQHNIHKADIPLQIIYNRALVQLGLCAFRHGNIRDAHQDLLDIQFFGRAKELLAQGLLPKPQERTPEQEKMEKRRLLPFHKHINLELIECVYLVSAMLLEIPDVAANEFSVRKKVISRSFYNQLRKNEEQPLVGLPESMREHVVAASKAMRVGNWKACRDFIINDKMNTKVWNLFYQANKVREMLVQKIREESLRAYLFTYSHVYDVISLATLSEMFDLENNIVHSIISKMIINEELMASLDEPTQTLIMHRTEPSRIQGLALQLADKVTNLVDQNERLWDFKQAGAFGGQQQRMGYQNRQENQNRNYQEYGQRQERNNRENRRTNYVRN